MLNRSVWAMSLGSWMAVTFTICVLAGVLARSLPIWHRMLETLLPGFRWISGRSFAIGLVETFLYGLYAGWLFASLHNFFARRSNMASTSAPRRAA